LREACGRGNRDEEGLPLERSRFILPQTASGSVSQTPAQLSTLIDGIDWRMPLRTHQPELSARATLCARP
jgi:transposase